MVVIALVSVSIISVCLFLYVPPPLSCGWSCVHVGWFWWGGWILWRTLRTEKKNILIQDQVHDTPEQKHMICLCKIWHFCVTRWNCLNWTVHKIPCSCRSRHPNRSLILFSCRNTVFILNNTLVLQKHSSKSGWQKWFNSREWVAWNISNLKNVMALMLERASHTHTHAHTATHTHLRAHVTGQLASQLRPWELSHYMTF